MLRSIFLRDLKSELKMPHPSERSRFQVGYKAIFFFFFLCCVQTQTAFGQIDKAHDKEEEEQTVRFVDVKSYNHFGMIDLYFYVIRLSHFPKVM